MSLNGEYRLNVICDNCGWKGRVVLSHGLRVNEGRCPNCDVRAIRRIAGPVLANLWQSERAVFRG